nr:DinB family protein [Flavobacterium algicola]
MFNNNLAVLKSEIESYQNESCIWITSDNIANSAGNLTLHILGNLNTYIGGILGNSGYVRNRELEFSTKYIPTDKLLEMIDSTVIIINQTLNSLDLTTLQEEFPILVLKEKTSTEYLLIHLTTHLTYHLGQINYHRRLLDI